MASPVGKKADDRSSPSRPLHTSRSFSRIESDNLKPITRSGRASTLQHEMSSKDSTLEKQKMAVVKEVVGRQPTAYENSDDEEEEEDDEEDRAADAEETSKLPKDFAELPIELISLTDR